MQTMPGHAASHHCAACQMYSTQLLLMLLHPGSRLEILCYRYMGQTNCPLWDQICCLPAFRFVHMEERALDEAEMPEGDYRRKYEQVG